MLKTVTLMFVAMSFIPLGDSAGKVLVSQYGFNPFFLAWSRFALGALMVVPFLPRGQFDARLFLDWRIWLRGLLITAGISSILTALQTEPLPNVFGAFFVGPILSYVLSVWLLKEKITPLQTTLLLLGFVGVLLVVKPGFGMTRGLGFAVFAGLCYGSFITANRWLSSLTTPRMLLLTHLTIGAVVLTPFGITQMPEFDNHLIALTLFSAFASMMGNYLLIVAYGRAPASKLAPMVYFQLIAATTLGWLIFGDFPDSMTLLGLGLLIATGFAPFLLQRQKT